MKLQINENKSHSSPAALECIPTTVLLIHLTRLLKKKAHDVGCIPQIQQNIARRYLCALHTKHLVDIVLKDFSAGSAHSSATARTARRE